MFRPWWATGKRGGRTASGTYARCTTWRSMSESAKDDRMRKIAGFLVLLSGFLHAQQDAPQADIGNGEIRAKLYLPDAEHGYYRATRFDWSGVIASLEYKGHNYFGKWFEKYDPKIHDAILGP